MRRLNIAMLSGEKKELEIKNLHVIEDELSVIGQQVEDDLAEVVQNEQEVIRMHQVISETEEVIQEAEEEKEALHRSHEIQNAIGLASFQRAVKSFERRTGVTYSNIGLESNQTQSNDPDSVKIATEGIVSYVKKLIRMLIDALNSLWEKVKAFFKNLFSGAEKLRKRAEKIKATSEGPSSEKYRGSSAIANGEYLPSTNLDSAVKTDDVIMIRNALIMELNSLIIDSDTLRAGLKYVLNKKPEVAKKYTEGMWSRGMDDDKDKWDKDYYMRQEVYLDYQFSKERYLHMIEVREYLRNKGVNGFVLPENIRDDEVHSSKKTDNSKKNDQDKITTTSVLEFAVIDGKPVEGSAFVDRYIKQATDSSEYRESLNDDIKDLSSGTYAKILEAAKKPHNKDEIIKLIKDCAEGPTRKEGAILNNKDGFVTYSSQKDIYFLGDYYDENTNVAKDATWEQISGGHSKINSDMIHDKNQKKVEEVTALSREESNALATAAMTAMENYKKMEGQERKLDNGFNKLLSEIKRLESDENIPADQLRVAGGFIRSSIGATIKMLVALNAYELRLTKAALDYAAASIRVTDGS